MTGEGMERLQEFWATMPSTEGLTIEESRQQSKDFWAVHRGAPEGANVTTTSAKGVSCDWVVADAVRSNRVLLYFHGGGFVFGSAFGSRELAARLSSATDSQVLVVDYRLAPEHPFPAAVDDCLLVYEWLLEEGTSPSDIVVAGDSAGGGLVFSLLLSLRDGGLPLPAAGVGICPWVDLTLSGDTLKTNAPNDPVVTHQGLSEMARHYLNGADPEHPLASPLFADLSGLPPILIQVGSTETLLDDSVRLASRLRTAGVQVELDVFQGMIHNWHYYGEFLPDAQRAIDRISVFVESVASSIVGSDL